VVLPRAYLPPVEGPGIGASPLRLVPFDLDYTRTEGSKVLEQSRRHVKVTAATTRARVNDLCLSSLAIACYLNRLATVGLFIHDTLRQSNDQLVLVIYITTATEAGFVPGSPAIARERGPFIHLTQFFGCWYRCSKDGKDKGEQGKQYPGGSVHREAQRFVKARKVPRGFCGRMNGDWGCGCE